MSVPDKEQVREILKDFEGRLRSVIERAWQEWLKTPDRARFIFLSRVRANIVFDDIARLARDEFQDDPNIRVILKPATIQFLFKRQVLVRFKKASKNGVGSNISTQAVLDFIDPQKNIPFLLPEILKIEICYSIDDLGTRIETVEVIARNVNKRAWGYEIEPAEPGAVVVPLPARAPDVSPPIVRPRRRKKGSQQGE